MSTPQFMPSQSGIHTDNTIMKTTDEDSGSGQVYTNNVFIQTDGFDKKGGAHRYFIDIERWFMQLVAFLQLAASLQTVQLYRQYTYRHGSSLEIEIRGHGNLYKDGSLYAKCSAKKSKTLLPYSSPVFTTFYPVL